MYNVLYVYKFLHFKVCIHFLAARLRGAALGFSLFMPNMMSSSWAYRFLNYETFRQRDRALRYRI